MRPEPRYGRVSEAQRLAQLVYDDVVKRAYERVATIFDDEPEPRAGHLLETYGLSELAADIGAEIGRDGIEWVDGEARGLEQNPDYRPAVAVGSRGKPGEFAQLAKDPTWADNYMTVLEGLHSGELDVTVDKHVPPDLRDVAKQQSAAIGKVVVALAGDQFRREWAESLNYGFSLWEYVLDVDDDDATLSASYRRPWTLASWILDEEEREWEGVSFELAGDGESYELPAEKCLLYSHLRTGLNLSGEGQLRFAAPHILIKQELIRLDMQGIVSHGLGWRVIESDADAPDAGNDDATVKVLDVGRATDNPTLQLAPGHRLNWISPGGVLPDFAGRIAYHDAQIEKALGARASTLDSATYANADLIDRVDRRTVRHYGSLFAKFLTDQLVPFVGRLMFGDEYLAGATVVKFDLAHDTSSAAVLVQLIQAGVITPNEEDEDVIRRQFNLPPRSRGEEVRDVP